MAVFQSQRPAWSDGQGMLHALQRHPGVDVTVYNLMNEGGAFVQPTAEKPGGTVGLSLDGVAHFAIDVARVAWWPDAVAASVCVTVHTVFACSRATLPTLCSSWTTVPTEQPTWVKTCSQLHCGCWRRVMTHNNTPSMSYKPGGSTWCCHRTRPVCRCTGAQRQPVARCTTHRVGMHTARPTVAQWRPTGSLTGQVCTSATSWPHFTRTGGLTARSAWSPPAAHAACCPILRMRWGPAL